MIELIQEIGHTHSHFQEVVEQCHPRRDIPVNSKGILPPKKNKKQKQSRVPYSTPQQIYDANLINDSLQKSFLEVPSHVVMAVRQRMRLSEDQVYMGTLGEDKSYISRLYADGGDQKFQKQAITQLFDSVHDKILASIYEDEYTVHQKKKVTKEQLRSGRDPSKLRQLKQKLQGNLSSLKSQITLNIDTINIEATSHQDFGPKSEKTKKAEQFVRHMRQLQQKDRRKRQQKRIKKQEAQVKSLQEKQNIQQRIKQEKHQLMIQKHVQKKKTKQQEKQLIQKQQQRFSQFFEEYKGKKPLYRRFQERYRKSIVMQENRKRLDILNKIKQERATLDLQEIKQHQQRYKDFMDDKQDQRESALELLMKERRRGRKKYYQGKFHSLIKQEEDQREDSYNEPRLSLEQLYKKRWEYAEMIRKNYMPKANAQKNKQLQQLLQKLKWSERLRSNSLNKNAHQEGLRNLQKMHQLIAQMRAKGRLRIPSAMETQSSKPNYPNYLHQMRVNPEYSSQYNRSKTINYDTMVQKDLSYASMQASMMEKDARRKQKYLSMTNTLDINQHMRVKKKVDQNYLQSARVKLAILSQIKE